MSAQQESLCFIKRSSLLSKAKENLRTVESHSGLGGSCTWQMRSSWTKAAIDCCLLLFIRDHAGVPVRLRVEDCEHAYLLAASSEIFTFPGLPQEFKSRLIVLAELLTNAEYTNPAHIITEVEYMQIASLANDLVSYCENTTLVEEV